MIGAVAFSIITVSGAKAGGMIICIFIAAI
jgi:hypothetical protein